MFILAQSPMLLLWIIYLSAQKLNDGCGQIRQDRCFCHSLRLNADCPQGQVQVLSAFGITLSESRALGLSGRACLLPTASCLRVGGSRRQLRKSAAGAFS
jgi:hypothetical protein